ncbi:hypothetical protein K490DRAFT_73946 [Saccharata proteae CBS 121410]|uniref:Uncharacterized protein n=1 Tax=Saccharata proteae CBS 121410 TaxID=1314787 RepID=A0A9P4HUT1_9PEZI|nr:hypothetical protein K490DRAFT_73946 [Saccharata proteae CBS 121410]
MDNNDRRQRQTNPTGYAAQQGLIQTPSQYPSVTAADRFRQVPLAQSPTSAPTTGRSATGQGYGYAYGEGAQFAGSQIQAEQPRTQQQYPQYASNMMYNSPYESVQPYQPRQSAAIEVLSTQFGVPQQYYNVPGEGGPTSAPAAGMAAQNVPSQYSSLSYTTQSPVGRDVLAPAYAAGMNAPTQGASHGAYPQANYPATQQDAAGYDDAYAHYQSRLKRTFEYVRDGQLSEGSRNLYEITNWLLGNAEALGLVRDEEHMHAERLKLWEEFNLCWLTTLQRQKEMTQEMAETGQPPHPPQSLIRYDYLEHLGKELVRLCDSMEKHGLVDYQMGVWEEEIVSILTTCLDLLEEHTGASGASIPRTPSASTARRR